MLNYYFRNSTRFRREDGINNCTDDYINVIHELDETLSEVSQGQNVDHVYQVGLLARLVRDRDCAKLDSQTGLQTLIQKLLNQLETIGEPGLI